MLPGLTGEHRQTSECYKINSVLRPQLVGCRHFLFNIELLNLARDGIASDAELLCGLDSAAPGV